MAEKGSPRLVVSVPSPRASSLIRGAGLVLLAASLVGCSLSDRILPTPAPTTDEDPPAGWAWHVSPVDHRGANGQVFEFVCPPDGHLGDVWGTDVYTDDSSICTAAVQAGLIQRVAGGRVSVRIEPGRDKYEGSTRNGVTSDDYGSWKGSFSFVP
jgi:LCCL domain